MNSRMGHEGVPTLMKRRETLAVAFLCLAIVVGASIVQANEIKEFTLEEAIRRGLELSTASQQAQFGLELVELEYKQAQVNARATVSPLQLAEAKLAYENAQYQLELQRVQTALEVESLYYSVMKAADTVLLREDALDRALQQVDVASMRHASGQITDVQLREAEQRLKEAELSYRQAVNSLHLARMQFAQLIGMTDEAWDLADEVIFVFDEVVIDEALAHAEARRFELIQAQQKIEDANRAIRLADNDYTPKIELERAQIQLAQAELELKQARDRVHHEVWQAVLRLEQAEAQYELAEDRRNLAADNLALAELRYQNGLNTLLDVLQAEAALAEAEVNAVAAAYDYNVARAQYLSAIGRGLERWPNLLESSAEGR